MQRHTRKQRIPTRRLPESSYYFFHHESLGEDIRHIDGKLQIRPIAMEKFHDMTMRELIEYEQKLWRWADAAGSTKGIADVLNAIYREVEWRAQEREWRDAAYPGRRPRAMAARVS